LQKVAIDRTSDEQATHLVPYTGPAKVKKEKESKASARSVSLPRERWKAGAKNKAPEKKKDDAGEWEGTLASIAVHMGKRTAFITKACPVLDEGMVGSYVVYMQKDGIHFMEITKYNKNKKHNFELKFMIGDDAGKLLNYQLRSELYKEDPSQLVGDWGVVKLT
jgi:hypothetical protein